MNAATHYRDTGDASELERFRGVTVGGHQLEVEPGEIEYLAGRGQLDFEEFYEQ